MAEVLVDTNLAVLLCVGLTDKSYIDRHKNLQAYTQADYELLRSLLDPVERIVMTPNIASETSNLCRQVAEPMRSEISETLARVIGEFVEIYSPSAAAVQRPEYAWLGVTDAAILEALNDGSELLTADHRLYIAAANAELGVVNFNHIREAEFGF